MGLVRFLAKRMAVLAMAVAAGAWVIDGFQPTVALGILLGCFFDVYKVKAAVIFLKKAAAGAASTGDIIARVFSSLAPIAVMAATAFMSTRLFAGIAIGLSLLPVFVCANAITEYAGITRNAWGDAP